MDAKAIERAIRAYNPWPIAWTTLEEVENNKKLWFPKLQLREGVNKKLKLKVFSAALIQETALELKEVQLEGKNKMDWKTFENGYIAVKRP